MIRYLLITIFSLSVTFTLPVAAQTQKQAESFSLFLQTQTENLGQASSNLLSMQGGLNGDELSAADSAYIAATNVQHYFDMLNLAVSIYILMVDSRDQATVKKYLILLSSQSAKAADLSLQSINRQLVRLSSPAVVSEVQKIRDLIIKIKDETRRVVPSK